MIKRLVEMQEFGDADEAEAARLLRSLVSAPPSEGMERRVYAQVCTGRLRGTRLVRVLVLVSSLLVSTTILCATLVRHFADRSSESGSGANSRHWPAPQPRPPLPPQEVQESDVVPPAIESAPADTGDGSPSAASPASHRRDRTKGLSASRRQTVASRAVQDTVQESPSVEVAPPPEEAALILAALRALRRDHDPVQAGVLAQSYLTRFPKGVIIEEALAVGIEAAVARQEMRLATVLSNQYLGRYPAGKFADLARKTLSANRP